MMKTGDIIKYYLKAKTPDGLKLMMLDNNVKRSAYHSYDIMFVNGFWYAWYESTADELIKQQVEKIGTK